MRSSSIAGEKICEAASAARWERPATPGDGVFASFWMGGFEGADHVNGLGASLDMAQASGHVDQLEADHLRAASVGLRTIRESVGWRLTEVAPGLFDLARVRRVALSAQRHGLQVIWTLMHYGLPADLNLCDDSLIERFVAFASAVAREVGALGARAPIYNLVNEIGFLAWAVSETNLMLPYRSDPAEQVRSGVSGYDVKCRLVRATLAASAAIRRIDPQARFIQVEPLVHVVAPHGRPELSAEAAQVNQYQWQVWDMLAGRTEAALDGLQPALDLIGVNHYHAGQWELDTGARLDWHLRDPRRRPFELLLRDVWQRYGRPLIVAETSHVGEGRAAWINEIASEVRSARAGGVAVQGICLYPLVDRPDWNDPLHWHRSGLWDVAPDESTTKRRVLCTDYAAALKRWQQTLPIVLEPGTPMKSLIVFSHLRWSFVYQRPQHLMSRLSEHYRVLFVEEPVHTDGQARLELISHGPNLLVVVPHTPVGAAGFHDDQLPVLEALLSTLLDQQRIAEALVWFYTPMALPLLAVLKPTAVIFDCMDQLSAFKHAPRQLRQREAALLKRCDLVLTGGPALYDAKRGLHRNVHCLPSSVDAAHYSPARMDAGSAHADDARKLQAGLATPRLGYFGVIDERFDIDLLKTMAQARPAWQFVMVGPVVKIDARDLPSEPNIHWLGMQPYDRLPYLMAGWDVCLMPFALNESTQFISPTKTLEYMAGEKPIVSTPVGDVIALYADTVRIAPAGPEFIVACEHALAESGAAREERIAAMLSTVQGSSWDRTAATVKELMDQVQRRPQTVPAMGFAPPADHAMLSSSVRAAANG